SLQAGGEGAGRPGRIRLADAEAIGELPLRRAWSPELMRGSTIAYGAQQSDFLIQALAPDYAVLRGQPVAPVRVLVSDDDRLRRRVVFLGSEVARELFGREDPIDKQVRLMGMAFTVIGVQSEKVQLSNYNRPDSESVFIPHTTAGQLWNT